MLGCRDKAYHQLCNPPDVFSRLSYRLIPGVGILIKQAGKAGVSIQGRERQRRLFCDTAWRAAFHHR